jgi:phospholipid/cholesterol/gamma-HCH transport system substrate-binding protein
MKRKKSDIFAETIVGVFMAAVLALLAYFTIVISGVDILVGSAKVPVSIEFTDVGGLKDRDSVMYRGMKVGVIDAIDLNGANVKMVARINSDVVLREKYRISVASFSLLGGNYLLLEEGEGAQLPLEGTVFRGEPPMDWMRDLGRIANSVSQITSGGELRDIVTNVQSVVARLNLVVSRVERGEGTVGKLLSSDDSVYRDLKETVATAKTAVVSVNDTFASAKTIAARVERGEGTVGRLLSSDDTVYQDLKASLENVRAVTARIKDGNGLLMKLADDEKLAADASALMECLSAASVDLASVASRLEKGEGTLGKLSADAKLYDEVTALVKDIRQVVDNYRDTTPISSFGSLIGGAL